MNSRAQLVLQFLLAFAASQPPTFGQCNPYFPVPLSQRPTAYEIDVRLDDATSQVAAEQTVRFTNHSPEPIRELRFYLYLNAFKNTQTTFLKGTPQIFGNPFTDRKANEWGWVDISEIGMRDEGRGMIAPPSIPHPSSLIPSSKWRFEKVDAGRPQGNPDDQSVLVVPLDEPIAAGATATFRLKWRAQMPRTIARAGHSRDFYLFCHWFPQLGVWEKKRSGEWAWNCHQFFRNTEFFADFGVYDVRITAADRFVMGASGCLVSEKSNGDGTTTRHFHVEDVIDFAWSAYPKFEVLEDRWQDVQIRILYPSEHSALAPRYLHALRFALEYLQKHVGRYPYPTITVVDPPFHGLNSGLMEYPTLITVGTFYGMPRGLRMTESLVVHEFVHQYFMGMVASNEKEEAWLDEGFVTYFEDRIIDAAYGSKNGLIDFWGYRVGNAEQTRIEYTTMENPRAGTVARPGWEFEFGYGKALIYSKTATTLRTLERLVGTDEMDKIIQSYFEKWKFKHPRGEDFMAHLKSQLDSLPPNPQNSKLPNFQIYQLFEKSIFDAVVLDYSVSQISNDVLPALQGIFGERESEFVYKNGTEEQGQRVSKITVQRRGDWVFPVEILVKFEDGSSEMLHWSGAEGVKVFEIKGKPPVVSAHLDPQQKLQLDLDLNNNSLTLAPETAPLWKYAAKAIFWIQNALLLF